MGVSADGRVCIWPRVCMAVCVWAAEGGRVHTRILHPLPASTGHAGQARRRLTAGKTYCLFGANYTLDANARIMHSAFLTVARIDMPKIMLSMSPSLICFASGGQQLNALIRAPRTSNSCNIKLR